MKNLCLVLTLFAVSIPALATDTLTHGQAVYLPIYSHIWHGDRVVDGKYPLKTLVSVLVSIRNTSLVKSIRITSAKYYSTNGKLLKEYVGNPVNIPPMGTHELFVERKEKEGGSGANFVIQWDTDEVSNPPVVEAVHAEIQGHQTLTFVTTGKPIQIDE